jgi:hypothetical protein
MVELLEWEVSWSNSTNCAPLVTTEEHEEHAPELQIDVARGNGTEVDQPRQWYLRDNGSDVDAKRL